MNQEKIGKFIAKCRKEKNLTQEQLAEKLGITYKAVSKWECGKSLPDASIMIELCNILQISVNDLLSGEIVAKEHYQEKLEENIIDTIDYTNKKVYRNNKLIFIMIMFLGWGLIFIAFTIYPAESSWGAIHSVLGLFISAIGFVNIYKELTILKKIILNIGYVGGGIILLMGLDYFNVVLNNEAPRFSYLIKTGEEMIVYKSPFCNVYRINRNSKNEYYIVDTKKVYNENTVPITPFNRDKVGIENIIKYKNKYIGNNSNISHLVDDLPLAEYGYALEINSLDLVINYYVTDWYINENYYLEKALIYNWVSIFVLIDNVEKVTFNFSGNSYEIKREQIEELYPHYFDIDGVEINKDNFNEYLENKMNDNNFIKDIFEKLTTE